MYVQNLWIRNVSGVYRKSSGILEIEERKISKFKYRQKHIGKLDMFKAEVLYYHMNDPETSFKMSFVKPCQKKTRELSEFNTRDAYLYTYCKIVCTSA